MLLKDNLLLLKNFQVEVWWLQARDCVAGVVVQSSSLCTLNTIRQDEAVFIRRHWQLSCHTKIGIKTFVTVFPLGMVATRLKSQSSMAETFWYDNDNGL